MVRKKGTLQEGDLSPEERYRYASMVIEECSSSSKTMIGSVSPARVKGILSDSRERHRGTMIKDYMTSGG